MSHPAFRELSQVLRKIDRPGSFCFSGSAPAVLPGLEVEGLGPIGLPLTAEQTKKLKELCEQAPYGKGEKTLVDTNVRRVWRMQPGRFVLRSPDWEPFVRQTVGKVQKELGLEKRKLESHLYDLLLYEPGSFFLPHRDGEKEDRMVATLVLVLPSSFEGGELVVRHEGQERVIDFSGDNEYRIHFAAFYADCEHEIRPLREGHRLCLIYNLTLAKSKKPLSAPRSAEHVEKISQALRKWAEDDGPKKLVVTLDHQYTQDGLTWDTLKGVDRAWAQALLEGARQADCQAHLALLTLHESGSAVDDGSYYGRGRWYGGEDEGPHEMEEVFETSLTADHWSDPDGSRPPLGTLAVDESEVLDPEAIRAVEPEEDFEGYTGNEGMTLERWYRHAAILLWPNRRLFDVLCDGGIRNAVAGLSLLMKQWRKAGRKEEAALRAQCIDFATAIIARWPETPPPRRFAEDEEPGDLFESLAALGEPRLIKAYLPQVLARDASVDPGKSLAEVCRQHGWDTFRPELEAVFQQTTEQTLQRNVRLLEHLCLAGPGKAEGWAALCQALAEALVAALERIDREGGSRDFWWRPVPRVEILASLARSLLATDQFDLLGRVVNHALANSKQYPLTEAHVAALKVLQSWIKANVRTPCPPLAHWLASCCGQLEALTASTPQPPAAFRRPAAIGCKCADCGELRRFLADPGEQVHHFRMAEGRRRHLEDQIRHHACDLDCRTERRGSPHTLVCTKNTATYERQLRKFHEDQEHLATLRAIQAALPSENPPSSGSLLSSKKGRGSARRS
jgi:hypothetical protein